MNRFQLLCLGLLFSLPLSSPAPGATPTNDLTVLPGFKVELVRAAQPDEGSWVCLAVDDQGRLIISPQAVAATNSDGQITEGGMLRITVSATGKLEKTDRIELPVGAAMGLLYAHDSLYVNGQGHDGTGLYRLRDTKGAGRFDEARLLKRFECWSRKDATGEHGPHAVVLGPDKMLYVINGNETKPAENRLPASPHKNFAEDQLLPQLLWPASYSWANGSPPGGTVWRTDPEGREWTLICGGLRNSYDLAFNRDGEMFTFDNDMDWDIGAPWYRPNRVTQLVSGGEYGWRRGSGKWPEYYPDSLPPSLEMPRSSPTGVKFGVGAKFPPKYRESLFLCDWAFGVIYAAQLTPNGASYRMTYEAFLTGRPLNVTDLEIGTDGALYFITGGRGTQSGLYRVTYELPIVRELHEWDLTDQLGRKARELRHQLEGFHGKADPAAVDFAWPQLGNDDRWIRYAARIAIEWQDPKTWRLRALAETNPNAGLTALLALARCDGRASQADLFAALAKFPFDSLTESQKLDELRVIEVSCIRQGRPDEPIRAKAIKELDLHYPSAEVAINRELCSLLVYLGAPEVVRKTMKLLASAPTQEEQLHYAVTLRSVKQGWTAESRSTYFNWFPEAARRNTGSDKFLVFLTDTRKDAIESLSDPERAALAPLVSLPIAPPPRPAPVPLTFVREWTMDELVPALNEVGKGRDFTRGREMFIAAQCIQCHRLGSEGGAVGPDLTAIASRFSRREILESILLPSKVISDQFQNTILLKKDGDEVSGRIVAEDDRVVTVAPNPLSSDRIIVSKNEIKSRTASKISPMPEGLANVMSKDAILDLLAYLESGGRPAHQAFRKE